MAENDPNGEVLFEAVINVRLENQQALADAAKIDALKKDIAGDVKVNVNLDLSNRSILNDLEALETTRTTKVNVDDSEISTAKAALNDLGADQSSKVNVDAGEVGAAKSELSSLERFAQISTRIVVSGDDLDDIKSQLEDIKTLSAVNVVLSIPAASMAVIETLQSLPGVGALVDSERAGAVLSARNEATAVEDLTLAQKLYQSAFGESVAANAVFINQLRSLGVESGQIEAAAFGAYQAADAFTAMGQDADLAQIAVAQNALVLNGLAKDATEASDIIASGVLGGANRRDDFLDTIVEYSSAFSELGITGQEALSLINTGIEAGFDNTDRIADLLREVRIRVGNEGDTAAQEALSAIGFADEAEAFRNGELSGAELMRGLIEGIRNAPVDKQLELGASIFGTQIEDFGVQAVLGLDTVDATFAKLEGRAAEASTYINDNLGTALTGFFNTINVKAGELLSSETIDLPGKINALKEGLTEATNVLLEGGSLGEAIEIGLNMPGFADSVARFESGVGNFLISVLELIAGVQDFTGNASGAESTRVEIARLAETQLSFDLKAVDTEDIPRVIRTALDRGVEESKIVDLATISADELISNGDVERARALADSLDRAGAIVKVGVGFNVYETFFQQGLDETFEQFEARIEEFRQSETAKNGLLASGTSVEFTPSVDSEKLKTLVDETVAQLEGLLRGAEASGNITDALFYAGKLGDTAAVEQLTAIAEQYRADFAEALNSGQVGEAIEISSYLPGDEAVRTIAQEKAYLFREVFGRALGTGDVEKADYIAWLLDDAQLQAQADALAARQQTVAEAASATDTAVAGAASSVVTNMATMVQAAADADAAIYTSIQGNTINASLTSMGDSAELNAARFTTTWTPVIALIDSVDNIAVASFGNAEFALDSLGEAFVRNAAKAVIFFRELINQSLSLPPLIGPVLELVASQMGKIATGSQTIAGALGGGSIPKFAEGGVLEGFGIVGDRGPEAVFADERVAVLNNRTTNDLLGAAASMFAGLEGARASNVVNNNSQRSVNAPINIYVASEAEAMSAAQYVGDAMRGFA